MWPEQVLVLEDDCNISGPYGIPTPGNPRTLGFYGDKYPNTLSEWTSFFFRNEEGSNHLSLLEWYTTYNRIGVWETRLCYAANKGDRDEEFFNLIYSVRGPQSEHFNYRTRLMYNLAWAYHDYIPYPEPIPSLLHFMKNHSLFQKLVAEGIEKEKSPYSITKESYAQKRDIFTRPKQKKRTKFTLA